MTSIILNAACFNEDIPIAIRIGLTNKGFANSIAPRLLEDKNYTRVVLNDWTGNFNLATDIKTIRFAKILSKTYIYAKELNLGNFKNPEKFLKYIKEDIPDMRLSSLCAIPFKYYSDFNIGCLKELNVVDSFESRPEASLPPFRLSFIDGTTEKQVVIKNLHSLEMRLTNSKIQDFILYGYFEHIDLYIQQNSYLHNMNKILAGVSFCKTLELTIEFCEDVDDLPYNMDFTCVFESLSIDATEIGNDCISSMIFNERLGDLEITADSDHHDPDEVLCPDINYSNTKLFLVMEEEELNLRISKLYENKHIRIFIRGDDNILKISNAKGKTFEITTYGEVEFDEEPENFVIKQRC